MASKVGVSPLEGYISKQLNIMMLKVNETSQVSSPAPVA